VSVGHKELKSDVGELNQFLTTDDRQPVKEVIGTEINSIPSKITRLHETIREQTLNEAKLSDVVVGRQENRYPIPVMKNHH
jgi:hypothetical protein